MVSVAWAAGVEFPFKVSVNIIVPAVVPLLRHMDAGARGHAAQLLEQNGWRPPNADDEMWFYLAKGDFSRTASFGAVAIPLLEAVIKTAPSSMSVGAVGALLEIGDPRVFAF